jgi:probable F420-dependent oxidoreductase
MSYVVLNSGIESDSAGHSTILASRALHRAPNAAEPAVAIRSTTWVGGTNGAIGGCGMSKGGIAGGAETVGLMYLLAKGIDVLKRRADCRRTRYAVTIRQHHGNCLILQRRKWGMKAGVVYPQVELGGDTGAVKAFAQAAEDLGYDHIVIYDHVLGAVHAAREPRLTGPYKETDPFHEPLVTFAYLAGVTKNLEMATGVIILPQRQTVLFAKQAADVDLFSGGRLRLGVGVGWNWVEYDGLEMSGHFRRRGKRQEQQVALIRKLWEQAVIEHEDTDHRIDRAGILPRPKRKIPIWFGGFSQAAYDRAARIGDGFMFSGRTQTEAVQIKANIEARLEELGRPRNSFGFESIQQYSRGDNQWPRDIAAWRDAGGSHISVVTMGASLTTVDAHIEALRRWRDVYDSVQPR